MVADLLNVYLKGQCKLEAISVKRRKAKVAKSDRHHIEWCAQNGYVFVSSDHSWLLDPDTPLWLPLVEHPPVIVSPGLPGKDKVLKRCIWFLENCPTMLKVYDAHSTTSVVRIDSQGDVTNQSVDEAIDTVTAMKQFKRADNYRDRKRLEAMLSKKQ